MYLKGLEIQGFKSFPEKTFLSFEKDISVIVGPNGSGKSNISDAILWVMGEQKSRMLRGGNMEDVIFGGTEKRGAMGFAQVTLILDNTSRILQMDEDEVSISRRYYRSGESEYYINRERVRLRDISELLMDTGLGTDGYSIIGQGRISEIVSARSTDRREIFEEAAGISRYRHRKDESERKLERAEENLVRICDKIGELELQIEPLRQQSETAKKYLLLRDELRALEISLWMNNLDKLQEQSALLRRDHEKAVSDCQAANSEQERLYAESERLSERMRGIDVDMESLRQILREDEAKAAELDSSSAVLKANIKNLNDTILRLSQEAGEQDGRVASIRGQIREYKDRIGSIDREKDELHEREEGILREDEEYSSGMDERSRELDRLLSEESSLTQRITEGRTEEKLLSESISAGSERREQLSEERLRAEQALAEAKTAVDENRAALIGLEEGVQSRRNVIEGHSMLMATRENNARMLAEKETSLTVDLRSCEERIRLLTDLEREMEGLANATRFVTKEAQKGTLRGVHAPLARLIHTDDRYTLAVETALGAHIGDIVVDTQEDGKAVIAFLKQRNGGRVTIQPIDVIEGAALRDGPQDEEGFIGLCSDLVQTEDTYRRIVSSLLGRIAVAETLSDAIAISRKYRSRFRIVTLDGQLVNVGGSLTGGSAAKNTGILSRANELEKLKVRRDKLETELEDCRNRKKEADRILSAAKYDLETAKEELASLTEDKIRAEGEVAQAVLLSENAENALRSAEEEIRENERLAVENTRKAQELRESIAGSEAALSELKEKLARESGRIDVIAGHRKQLEEKLSALRASRAALNAEAATAANAVAQLESLCEDILAGTAQRRDAIEETRGRISSMQDEIGVLGQRSSVVAGSIETHKAALAQMTEQKLELEGRRSAVDRSAQEQNRRLLEMEKEAVLLEQKRLSADNEEKQIVDRLWDSYELTRTEAQAVRQPVESVTKVSRQVSDLRRSISALGTPNLGAVEEYKRVKDRYDFLSGQKDDAEKSRQEILKILDEITERMESIFVQEIREINDSFQSIFIELFGGGKASVSLEDENDVLNCGIDIRIQPPGKAISNISLLSGGEKAFVAIALYFAIIRVRPTPFCVMDEIESALDEENVSRFAEYLRRMCGNTQFIVITHRRGTMEEADQLYGVTMQEKGVSTILAMDMEEALNTIR